MKGFKLPLRELRRRPSRFVVATVVLSFLATLLLFLGGLLDGLYLGSTGAIRAQRADAIVFSASARDSFLRSRITADVRATVEGVDGVDRVGGLAFALLGAQVPGESTLADVRGRRLRTGAGRRARAAPRRAGDRRQQPPRLRRVQG